MIFVSAGFDMATVVAAIIAAIAATGTIARFIGHPNFHDDSITHSRQNSSNEIAYSSPLSSEIGGVLTAPHFCPNPARIIGG
jgi:hypothetical protein